MVVADPGSPGDGPGLGHFFRDGLGVDRVYELVDDEVTVEALTRFAAQAAEDVGSNGTLWFVFVGHGAPGGNGDGLLVGVDAQQTAESLEARGVALGEVLGTLEGGDQRRTVAFVDACFSGRDGQGAALAPGLQPVLPVRRQAPLRESTVVLSAAASDQFAGPLPGANRPAFSFFLLGALRGWAASDGAVTARASLEFVEQKLRAIPGRVQTPEGTGDLSQVLVQGAEEEDPLPAWSGRSPAQREQHPRPEPRQGHGEQRHGSVCDAVQVRVVGVESVRPIMLHLEHGGFRVRLEFTSEHDEVILLPPVSRAVFSDVDGRALQGSNVLGDDWYMSERIPSGGILELSVVFPRRGDGPPRLDVLEVDNVRADGPFRVGCRLRAEGLYQP